MKKKTNRKFIIGILIAFIIGVITPFANKIGEYLTNLFFKSTSSTFLDSTSVSPDSTNEHGKSIDELIQTIPKPANSSAPSTNSQSVKINEHTTTTAIEDTSKPPPVEFIVYLILPSNFSNAEIRVDGKPANILKRGPIITKISVTKKDTPHEISLQIGNKILKVNQFISKDSVKISNW